MRLRPDNPALSAGRTFRINLVKQVKDTSRLLKSVKDNNKLGKGDMFISKGKWRGMAMYALTLEERATCTRSCRQWDNCYGNNMMWAHRVDHQDPEFLPTLEREVKVLTLQHPHGFVVRLHVLGDFYSPAYVGFWQDLVDKHPELHIFGFTHHRAGAIHEAIRALNSDRVWIRFSDAGGEMSANVEGDGIQCPEQSGKTKSCLTCGLCWSTKAAIRFTEH